MLVQASTSAWSNKLELIGRPAVFGKKAMNGFQRRAHGGNFAREREPQAGRPGARSGVPLHVSF